VSKGLFPLQIVRDVRIDLLEPRHALDLFKLVDSNRAHLREWLPFVDDYKSVTAATQFIKRNREENSGEKVLVMGIWAGQILAGEWKNRTVLGLNPDVFLARFSAQNKSLLRIPTNSFTR